MKLLSLSLCLFIALLLIGTRTPALSQTDSCPALIETALDLTSMVCSATDTNEACYGHARLEAQAQPEFAPVRFSEAGDRVTLTALRSLRLSALDIANRLWGVALMKVDAHQPLQASPAPVTLLLFGDVEVENRVDLNSEVSVAPASRRNVNLRFAPSTDAYVLGTLRRGETAVARGRNAAGSWLYVEQPETELRGWVSAGAVRAEGDTDELTVVSPSTAHFGAMQAFYLRTGESTAPSCSEIPHSGLLIQTPEGIAEVSLWINEVKVSLGSTAFVQAQPNREMTITMLEGHADVEAFGVSYTALIGEQISVPLNEQGLASDVPQPPVPLDIDEVQTLPVSLLEREIEIPETPPPARPLPTPVPVSEDEDDCPGSSCNAPVEDDDCPGNSCNAPGRGGGNPPGQGGTPPGQNDDCPGNSCNAPGRGGGSPPGQGGTPPGQNTGCSDANCGAPDNGGVSPSEGGSPPGQSDDCPGNSCNAPGQGGGSPPGQGGTPPGQNDDCPGNSCNAPGRGGGNPPGQGGTPPGQHDDCPGNSCNAPGRGRGRGSN